MAIIDYASLKAEVIGAKGWSHRKDLDLKFDTFVQLAEEEMFNHPDEALRLREIEVRSTSVMSITSRFLALPTGFETMRSLHFNVTNLRDKIIFRTPEGLDRRDGTGRPCFFAITGEIEFDILPEEAYAVEMNYIKKPSAITSLNTTNEALTANPSIYLFGTLYKLFTYAVDSEQAALYRDMFYNAIQGANISNDGGRFGVLPATRVEGSTP